MFLRCCQHLASLKCKSLPPRMGRRRRHDAILAVNEKASAFLKSLHSEISGGFILFASRSLMALFCGDAVGMLLRVREVLEDLGGLSGGILFCVCAWDNSFVLLRHHPAIVLAVCARDTSQRRGAEFLGACRGESAKRISLMPPAARGGRKRSRAAKVAPRTHHCAYDVKNTDTTKKRARMLKKRNYGRARGYGRSRGRGARVW